MSSPRYSGSIAIPARFIDHEVKELLAKEYEVRFKEPDRKEVETEEDSLEAGIEIEPTRELDQELELADSVSDWIEVKVVDGIFYFHDGEARYGEFYELEELLIKKGVPFDRESGMEWNASPAIRIFRPGDPAFDYTDSIPSSYEEVISVRKIRELLGEVRAGFSRREGPIMLVAEGFAGINHIEEQLAMAFPPYPPLADFVAATEGADDVVQESR